MQVLYSQSVCSAFEQLIFEKNLYPDTFYNCFYQLYSVDFLWSLLLSSFVLSVTED